MIKSQDELPQSGRDNSTLIEVISKLETTTKELERVKKLLSICRRHLNASLPFIYRELIAEIDEVLK